IRQQLAVELVGSLAERTDLFLIDAGDDLDGGASRFELDFRQAIDVAGAEENVARNLERQRVGRIERGDLEYEGGATGEIALHLAGEGGQAPGVAFEVDVALAEVEREGLAEGDARSWGRGWRRGRRGRGW